MPSSALFHCRQDGCVAMFNDLYRHLPVWHLFPPQKLSVTLIQEPLLEDRLRHMLRANKSVYKTLKLHGTVDEAFISLRLSYLMAHSFFSKILPQGSLCQF